MFSSRFPIKRGTGAKNGYTNRFAVHSGILICGPQGGNTCRANEYVEIDSSSIITRTFIQAVLDLVGIQS